MWLGERPLWIATGPLPLCRLMVAMRPRAAIEQAFIARVATLLKIG